MRRNRPRNLGKMVSAYESTDQTLTSPVSTRDPRTQSPLFTTRSTDALDSTADGMKKNPPIRVDQTLGEQPSFQLLPAQPTFDVDDEESPLILDGQVVARGHGMLHFPRRAIFRLRDATLYGYAKRALGAEAASASMLGAVVTERAGGQIKIEFVDGSVLKMTPETLEDTRIWLEALRKATSRNIERFYRFGGHLGEGQYGKVIMGYSVATGEPVAIKVMAKNELTRTQLKNVDREITLATMDMAHPNLVQTFDVFNDNHNVYVVMELMAGGELFEMLEQRGALTEDQARHVFKQILKGVRYLHGRGVAHRDLKLENVLVTRFTFPVVVKLADFGLSGIKLQSQGERPFQGTYGTPMYIAPEVALHRKYGTQADVWSCGVMLYVMLSGGEFPFFGESVKEVLAQVRKAQFDFDIEEFDGISANAKHLISQLLEPDPNVRLTPDMALRHAWFDDAKDNCDDAIADHVDDCLV